MLSLETMTAVPKLSPFFPYLMLGSEVMLGINGLLKDPFASRFELPGRSLAIIRTMPFDQVGPNIYSTFTTTALVMLVM